MNLEPSPKAGRKAAEMLRDIASDPAKTIAMALLVPAVVRAMSFVPQGTPPSLAALRSVMLDAAEALDKI